METPTESIDQIIAFWQKKYDDRSINIIVTPPVRERLRRLIEAAQEGVSRIPSDAAESVE